MRAAYFTPLNPDRSGISDYNEELLPYLSKYMDIDLFVKNKKLSNSSIKENFKVYDYRKFPAVHLEKPYDTIIYHMGNNYKLHEHIFETMIQYPGIVVLHDYAIHHFMAENTLQKGNSEQYTAEMIYNYGYEGLEQANKFFNGEIAPLWESDSISYPLNKKVIDSCSALILTSDFVYKKIITNYGSDLPSSTIPLHTPEVMSYQEMDKLRKELREKYNLPENNLILGSFGFATKNKRIHVILETLGRLLKTYDQFTFIIVGETSDDLNIKSLIKNYHLEKNVVVTGYTDLEQFKEYIILTDICFNLRYPIQGESSAALVRMMGMAKLVIVTDIGAFADYPDDTVIKIPYDNKEQEHLYNQLLFLFNNNHKLKEVGERASTYIKENQSLEVVSKKYHDFIFDIVNGKKVNARLAMNPFYNTIAVELVGLKLQKENYLITSILKEISEVFDYN
ncbi:hypothetical protein AV654_06270 [Paenibacillus elgii]|uniref:Glycosyl transferase family 1 domain-containing protein n=1 Tax=Paenibacillus elgii TaxID=189691 RepID=A0A163SZE9_9BACL|nr:glycosyltransferase family 4 protein [Paenibacillus elgii]KZE70486.1 hypothetical protein AV654_06270 [Paenibacillus elgii]